MLVKKKDMSILGELLKQVKEFFSRHQLSIFHNTVEGFKEGLYLT